MKAIVITKPGDADVLQIAELPKPEPAENEVLIKVRAAGVNRPDIAQRMGKYAAPAGAPQDIPGLEVSGIIEKCGLGVVRWKVGDEVCALLAGGGYAEFAVAHGGNCLPVPGNVSLQDAASLPETVFTVWHNVFQKGKLKKGEHLLVHGGTSGIGITAIQIAHALGARVFCTAGSAEKCTAALKLGASICINYKQEDFEQVLKAEGADVILDMIGGEYFEKNISLLREDGRLVFINAMQGTSATLNVMDIMRRRLTITGSTLRNRSNDFKQELAAQVEEHVWPLITQKLVTPVVYKTFPLARAAAAHQLMESSEHIGKILLLT